MQKKEFVLFFSSILLITMISFVSAQFYGRYSLSDILNSVDPSTMILGVAFIVFFAFLNAALSRFFIDNKAIGGVIAFAISLLIIYGINRTGLDFEGFFYNIGFSEGFLATIISLVLIGGAIYLGIKYGFGILSTIIGGFFIILSFTDFIYETGTTFFIGVIFLVIGIWLLWRKKKRELGNPPSNPQTSPVTPTVPTTPAPRQSLQKVQQRQRTQRELQKKYDQYRYAAEAIVKKVGHIPAKGTPEYKQWKNYTNAVKTVERMAAKQGFRLK